MHACLRYTYESGEPHPGKAGRKFDANLLMDIVSSILQVCLRGSLCVCVCVCPCACVYIRGGGDMQVLHMGVLTKFFNPLEKRGSLGGFCTFQTCPLKKGTVFVLNRNQGKKAPRDPH